MICLVDTVLLPMFVTPRRQWSRQGNADVCQWPFASQVCLSSIVIFEGLRAPLDLHFVLMMSHGTFFVEGSTFFNRA